MNNTMKYCNNYMTEIDKMHRNNRKDSPMVNHHPCISTFPTKKGVTPFKKNFSTRQYKFFKANSWSCVSIFKFLSRSQYLLSNKHWRDWKFVLFRQKRHIWDLHNFSIYIISLALYNYSFFSGKHGGGRENRYWMTE